MFFKIVITITSLVVSMIHVFGSAWLKLENLHNVSYL